MCRGKFWGPSWPMSSVPFPFLHHIWTPGSTLADLTTCSAQDLCHRRQSKSKPKFVRLNDSTLQFCFLLKQNATPSWFFLPCCSPRLERHHYSPRPRAGTFYLLSAEQLVNSLPARLHSGLTDRHQYHTLPHANWPWFLAIGHYPRFLPACQRPGYMWRVTGVENKVQCRNV